MGARRRRTRAVQRHSRAVPPWDAWNCVFTRCLVDDRERGRLHDTSSCPMSDAAGGAGGAGGVGGGAAPHVGPDASSMNAVEVATLIGELQKRAEAAEKLAREEKRRADCAEQKALATSSTPSVDTPLIRAGTLFEDENDAEIVVAMSLPNTASSRIKGCLRAPRNNKRFTCSEKGCTFRVSLKRTPVDESGSSHVVVIAADVDKIKHHSPRCKSATAKAARAALHDEAVARGVKEGQSRAAKVNRTAFSKYAIEWLRGVITSHQNLGIPGRKEGEKQLQDHLTSVMKRLAAKYGMGDFPVASALLAPQTLARLMEDAARAIQGDATTSWSMLECLVQREKDGDGLTAAGVEFEDMRLSPKLRAAIDLAKAEGVFSRVFPHGVPTRRVRGVWCALGASIRVASTGRLMRAIFCDATFPEGDDWEVKVGNGCRLTMMGIDGAHNAIMLGWAAVNTEDEANWTWFLTKMAAAYGGWLKRRPFVCFSDRDKGLKNSVAAVFNKRTDGFECEHLYDLFHVQRNINTWLKKQRVPVQRRNTAVDQFRRAAMAYAVDDFDVAVGKFGDDLTLYLDTTFPEYAASFDNRWDRMGWARCFQPQIAECAAAGLLGSAIAEGFNGTMNTVRGMRSLTTAGFFQAVNDYTRQRIILVRRECDKQARALRVRGNRIGHAAERALPVRHAEFMRATPTNDRDLEKRESALWSGAGCIRVTDHHPDRRCVDVTNGQRTHTVTLGPLPRWRGFHDRRPEEASVCTCGRPQIRHVPCRHMYAAISMVNDVNEQMMEDANTSPLCRLANVRATYDTTVKPPPHYSMLTTSEGFTAGWVPNKPRHKVIGEDGPDSDEARPRATRKTRCGFCQKVGHSAFTRNCFFWKHSPDPYGDVRLMRLIRRAITDKVGSPYEEYFNDAVSEAVPTAVAAAASGACASHDTGGAGAG